MHCIYAMQARGGLPIARRTVHVRVLNVREELVQVRATAYY